MVRVWNKWARFKRGLLDAVDEIVRNGVVQDVGNKVDDNMLVAGAG